MRNIKNFNEKGKLLIKSHHILINTMITGTFISVKQGGIENKWGRFSSFFFTIWQF